ncbi:hypothetical protein A2914_02550 [Candidatus Nomurabacteria bacterium RIFCSPLOWO2_01_FULL_41_21]|uniref:Uncharacterized protein n=2 Tax=Candidatus Nomuraibacteriota TaxID=1752729 RepID=A0A1F6V361_9BACT|nr:MAG: hypothetical protein A2733_02565 [Candidatus Nomurabacteria bacterium RIFCSPHIGHO2_01_FULL_40_20]OGI88845.1 MAG: hypothetical protein A2914_02550 [Candidatus Nomurabacteria bacterium RIFCSPLOWO2_01_FULL_41_21]
MEQEKWVLKEMTPTEGLREVVRFWEEFQDLEREKAPEDEYKDLAGKYGKVLNILGFPKTEEGKDFNLRLEYLNHFYEFLKNVPSLNENDLGQEDKQQLSYLLSASLRPSLEKIYRLPAGEINDIDLDLHKHSSGLERELVRVLGSDLKKDLELLLEQYGEADKGGYKKELIGFYLAGLLQKPHFLEHTPENEYRRLFPVEATESAEEERRHMELCVEILLDIDESKKDLALVREAFENFLEYLTLHKEVLYYIKNKNIRRIYIDALKNSAHAVMKKVRSFEGDNFYKNLYEDYKKFFNGLN